MTNSIAAKRQTLLSLASTMAAGALMGVGVTACGGSNDDAAATVGTVPVDADSATAFLTYKDPYHAKVDAAGYIQKTALGAA